MHVFNCDKDFEQASFDLVARMVFDHACKIFSDGNSITDLIGLLFVLSSVAYVFGMSVTTINAYSLILQEELDRSIEGEINVD